ADGVGGGAGGETASRLAVEVVTRYVSHSVQCYYASGGADETFLAALQDAAMQSHADLLAMADSQPELAGMATTLTLWIGAARPAAPRLPRGAGGGCARRSAPRPQRPGTKTRARGLIDAGGMARGGASRPGGPHPLSSATGGGQTAPFVTRLEQQWGNVGML